MFPSMEPADIVVSLLIVPAQSCVRNINLLSLNIGLAGQFSSINGLIDIYSFLNSTVTNPARWLSSLDLVA
jgi:hypothetical protein